MTEILSTLSSLDGNILLWIQENLRSEFLTPLFRFISISGNAGLIWIAITCFLLAFKKTRKTGVMCAIALVFSLIFTNFVFKPLVARVRPYDVIDALTVLVKKPNDFSFPSGHSSAAFAVAWVMLLHLPKKIGIPALVYAFLMSFSRLYLGVHYPSDVLGGILLGVLYGVAAIWVVSLLSSARKHRNDAG